MEAAEVLQRSDKVFADRVPYQPAWQEIRDFLYPEGPSFNSQEVEGQRNRDRIVSGIGESTLEMATAAVVGLTVNPATQWKMLAPIGLENGRDYFARVALEKANERMLHVYHAPRSRFYVSYLAMVREYLAYGIGSMFIADRPGDLPLFVARPLAQMAFAEGEDFEIDEAHWRFQLTAKQALQRWGDATPPKVREKANDAGKCMDKMWFRHCVWARTNYDAQGRRPEDRPFAEFWISEEDKATIGREGGYSAFPYVVPREGQRPGEVYGRGRGVRALADTKMFQRVRRAVIQGAEKTINPPMMIPDEGVISNNGKLSLRPAAPNYIRADYMARGAGPQPILTNARVDVGLDFEEAIKTEIGDPLLRNVLSLPREPRMPTSHVLALEEEAMRVASPVVEALQTEALAPCDAILFPMMARDGAFDDIFPEGMRVPFRTQFMSPASKIAKLRQARAIAQRLEIFLPVAQSRPDLLDQTDWPTAYREVGDILGVPAHWDHDAETVAEMQKARNDAAEEQAQQEGAKNYTTAAKNLAPLLQVIQGGQQQGAR